MEEQSDSNPDSSVLRGKNDEEVVLRQRKSTKTSKSFVDQNKVDSDLEDDDLSQEVKHYEVHYILTCKGPIHTTYF